MIVVPGTFLAPRGCWFRFSKPVEWRLVVWMGRGHDGGDAVHKPESLPIDKIYVPVKRRKDIKPDVVQEIAESMLDIGQQAPIVVRPDEDRFILVEGLHRLEACRALGEPTILGLVVSAEEAHPKMLSPQDAAAEAQRQNMERLKKLRLEKEAAEKQGTAAEARTAPQRHHADTTSRTGRKAGSSQPARGTAGATPKTLSEWVKQQERTGGRY